MGMTMSQKILAYKAGMDSVKPGDLIQAKLDMVLANDITAPVAVNEFEKADFAEVFHKDKIALVLDHFTPNKDIKAAEQCKQVREFADKHEITHFYEGGNVGVEHALLPEKGLVAPGNLVIGADSHTCTYGAVNAFSTGIGSTDMAVGMATGMGWFKVPAAIRFNLTGKLSKNVSGKDLILYIIGKIGVDGALYRSMEFTGEGVHSLTMDDRFTIANMAIEAGAKNGIFEPDDVMKAYVEEHAAVEYQYFYPDADAEYEQTIDIDLSTLVPQVAFPHLPENTKTIAETEAMNIKIDQVVIGSCTNGRISDLEIAANILKGKKVKRGVRVMVLPATPKVYTEAMMAGYLKIFMDAGCVIGPPSCGPCLGGHLGILAKGERCVSTTNRNFVGRMGHTESEVYLASPAVAAASAVAGVICGPDSL